MASRDELIGAINSVGDVVISPSEEGIDFSELVNEYVKQQGQSGVDFNPDEIETFEMIAAVAAEDPRVLEAEAIDWIYPQDKGEPDPILIL